MTREAPGREASELVSLTERAGSLGVLRVGFVLVLLALGLVDRDLLRLPAEELAVGSLAYLLLLVVPPVVRRSSRRVAWVVMATSLLIDGVYLGWVAYATGGTQSPLRILILVHVVAVTLLASYRTGLKLAAWHSLLFLVAGYAQAANAIAVRDALPSALPGGPDFRTTSMIQIGVLWVVAIATAACSAVNERELRGQKVDLEGLSELVGDLDRGAPASEIPSLLLDRLTRTFGFSRGVVLASPEGDLVVVAAHGAAETPAEASRLDGVIERAWEERRPQLVRALDAGADPRLNALLPNARNLLVVPLVVERAWRLGVVVVEVPGRGREIKRWVVTLVEQFVSHAALTLRNAWLREQLEGQLEENRGLQRQLVAQNLELELKVQERTQELRTSLHDLQVVDEQRRRLLGRLVHAEEEERQRIAGDIHDDPIQKMIAASMRLQLLRRKMTEPEDLETINKLLAVVTSCIKGLRNLIFELRPYVLDEHGLGVAIREYLESLEADFEFRVQDEMQTEPPAELRVVLYRMAQEAFANIRKHAEADRVDVVLESHERGFLVRITDDGVGFSAPAAMRSERGHLGLTSMRERAEMAGGWCRLHSLPGEGTTVEFWVPAEREAPPGEDRGPVTEEPVEILDIAPQPLG